MRLERLEINGFKSFSDRSELAFDQGVTAIVGPNGCGKSNVADAITWVMGEQSAKSLRGDKMEDVIFNGSDARKPTASAEVRLRFSGFLKTVTGPSFPAGPAAGNGHGSGDGDGNGQGNGNGHHADETGNGAGTGYNLNLPLPAGTSAANWFAALETACLRIKMYGPDALVVSLGVDTYAGDPLSHFTLQSGDYLRLGERLAFLDLPTAFILEGGYAVKELGINVVNVLEGFETAE